MREIQRIDFRDLRLSKVRPSAIQRVGQELFQISQRQIFIMLLWLRFLFGFGERMKCIQN